VQRELSPDTNEKVGSGKYKRQWHFRLDYAAIAMLIVSVVSQPHGGGANLLDAFGNPLTRVTFYLQRRRGTGVGLLDQIQAACLPRTTEMMLPVASRPIETLIVLVVGQPTGVGVKFLNWGQVRIEKEGKSEMNLLAGKSKRWTDKPATSQDSLKGSAG
jgi:hypothetical protein